MALPSGYTPLEYIESTGSQYVDTGFKPNQDTRVVMDVEPTTSQDTKTIFGARIAWKQADYTFWYVNDTQFQTDYGDNVQTVDVDNLFQRITIDKNKNVTTVGSYKVTNTANAFQSEFPMYLFAMNQNGAVDSRMITAKLYSCQIYDNGTLVLDYIPVQRVDGTAGLLDQVNFVFYPDAAGVGFVAGPVAIYTELEYIESDGTQYIDTRVKPNQDSRMVVDFEVLSNNTSESHISSARTNGGTPLWTLYYSGNEYATRYGTGAVQTISSLNGAGRHVFDKNRNVLSIDGETVNTVAYETFSVSSTLVIFCRNDGTAKNAHIKGRLRAYRLYDNGTLVRDYIPVQRLDGAVGLLDKVNNVFYPDVAGGNFIAGPVIVPPDPPEPPGPYEPPDYIARTQAYMATLREPFQKLCRLRFLQPDGSTAFSLDNNPKNRRSGAFIADGSIATNLQNGKRRTATVMLSNLDGSFDYNVNTVWFGTEIAIDEGVILPDGEEYYIQQGVFLIENPTESIRPGNRIATYNLVDKWANLDGTLFGNLESTYEVPNGTNIFQPINAILALDKGNGQPVDRVTPIYTEYYNSKSQALPDGSTASIINAPYTLRVDSDNGTYADVILGLAGMVNAWIGYDQTGALRIDPSQDDILDTNKPVLWQFSMDKVTFLGADYTVKNTEVYNDYIVIGELLDDNSQPAGRATNLDPRSDTNVQTIGRKTFRMSAPGFATDQQCQDLAVWKLKRSSALQKAITISCSQIFHIEENSLVSIVRTDKPGSPVERHLVMGFTRPLVATGEMQINAVSVQDFVTATVTSWPE